MTNLNELYPMARRPLIATMDAGRAYVLVQLNDGRSATVDRSHFHRLMNMGLSPNWFINCNGNGQCYVRANFVANTGWGNIVMVSRLILTPRTRGFVVRHKDLNPLNLTRDNLVTQERKSRATAWESRLLRQCAAAEMNTLSPSRSSTKAQDQSSPCDIKALAAETSAISQYLFHRPGSAA